MPIGRFKDNKGYGIFLYNKGYGIIIQKIKLILIFIFSVLVFLVFL